MGFIGSRSAAWKVKVRLFQNGNAGNQEQPVELMDSRQSAWTTELWRRSVRLVQGRLQPIVAEQMNVDKTVIRDLQQETLDDSRFSIRVCSER